MIEENLHTIPSVEALMERIRFLEETNQWMLDSFEDVSAIDDQRASSNSRWDKSSIYGTARAHLRRLVGFEAMAFFRPDETNNEFVLEEADPAGERESIIHEVNQLINEGLFGWALHQNRPIPIPSRNGTRVFVLHGLETRRNVIGMFVGIAKSSESIPNKFALNLMSIVLFKTAVGLEQLELYRRISNQNRILEQKVEERTKELMNAKDIALRASRLKSEFVANMSHELRTPLSGIIGISELLIESEEGKETRRYATMIRNSGDTLLAIINDILDFSKIEAGKLTIERISFDLVQIIAEVVAILEGKADAKGLRIKCEYALGDLPNYYGDPLRVRQVIMNLVGNAIKFTNQGFITVRAAIEEQGAEQPVVKISVIDTGIGIEEEVQANLFQSFTQGDGSTTRKYGGTGLGLAISKQLVELMGGRIGVQSYAGKGSTFWFTLPLPSQAQRQESKSLHANKKEASLSGFTTHENTPFDYSRGMKECESFNNEIRALVAEDNQVNQEVSRAMLTQIGFQVTVVPDGLRAVQENNRSPFDIIFMDCQMPVMDGYEATRQIRQSESPERRAIIIAVTAHAFPGDRESCIQAGMDDYIAKPFKQAELRSIITKWTAHLRANRENARDDKQTSLLPSTTIAQVIDKERIEEIKSIKSHSRPSLLGRVIQHFQHDFPLKVASMREGTEHGDAFQVRKAAHALRGSSAQVGAIVVAKVCEQIEILAIKESVEGTSLLIDVLEDAFKQAVEQLVTLVPKEEL